jgi:hypothetical protein
MNHFNSQGEYHLHYGYQEQGQRAEGYLQPSNRSVVSQDRLRSDGFPQSTDRGIVNHGQHRPGVPYIGDHPGSRQGLTSGAMSAAGYTPTGGTQQQILERETTTQDSSTGLSVGTCTWAQVGARIIARP